MALTKEARRPRWHFWTRFAGLTGLLLVAAGLIVWHEPLAELHSRAAGADEEAAALAEWATIGMYVTAGGGVLVLLALLFEIGGAVRLLASRRAALGSNVFLQIALAVLLLAGVNAFSFFHHARFDWTRDHEFTIKEKLRQRLGELRGDTRIVVFQRHMSFGQMADKPDNYDAAAERKIVEKVKDLAEQFQELGPRFHVELLDIQDNDFQEKLTALKGQAPKLAEAIEKSPENSIFFFADGKVQQLGFHDIYQLDKQESQSANHGRGNLVLRDQGVEPFVNKVLNIDEKKPRVAIGVIHEVLGLEAADEGSKEIGMTGLKKVLAARGFEGRDLILKQWRRGAMPTPAVLTHDENKFERLEVRLAQIDNDLRALGENVKEVEEQRRTWKDSTVDALKKKYAIAINVLGTPQVVGLAEIEAFKKRTGREPRTVPITEDTRRSYLAYLDDQLPELQEVLKEQQHRRAEAALQQSELRVEDLAEQRRISDVRAKMDRMLAGVDLLVIPRLTLIDVANGQRLRNWFFSLDGGQVAAIKDFMKAGKPVLFLLGPPNESPSEPPPPGLAGDRLEELLTDLGIKMPAQAVLFDIESQALAEQQAGFLIPGPPADVPPVAFAWDTGAARFPGAGAAEERGKPNPIHTSLSLAARSVGKTGALDLRLRNPRPVYYDPLGKDRPEAGAVFMKTSKESWNESQPFASEDYTPKFERAKADDPSKGTLLEKRRGPFPIAIAVETKVPASWYDKGGKPATVRVAVIGHGGVFAGSALVPAREKLLLDVSNWLLGRNSLLARDDLPPWQYPRVQLSDSTNALWQWGTRLGMPVLFVYLGFVVLLVRRMR